MADLFRSPPYAFGQFQRHFSVSLYPDEFGRMYSANPAKVITESPPQLEMPLGVYR